MAIPLLYWMLECPQCRSRRVVRDYFLERVANVHNPPAPDDGFGGRPLPLRYKCLKGCPGHPQVIGSVFSPDDAEVWLEDPYRCEKMSPAMRGEWIRLMEEAGLGPGAKEPEPPPIYWMLECPECRHRWVVRDFKFRKDQTASGIVWRPVPGLRRCPRDCPDAPRIAGSIYSLDDEEMYLEYPHTKQKMTGEMREEWSALLKQMPVIVPPY